MAEIYDIGDKPRLTVTFTDIAGVVTDPATVTCRVTMPSGAKVVYTYPTSPELTKTSTGIYNLDLTITEATQYKFKWVATGAAAQGYLNVRRDIA